MTDFSTLVRRFATAGTLDAAELRALLAVATTAEAAAGIAESVGCVGGTEAAVARILAAACAEQTRFEADLRAIVTGELRPSDISAFLWRVANERGRPPADVAQAVGAMQEWGAVADALERRLIPPKAAPSGVRFPHEVAR